MYWIIQNKNFTVENKLRPSCMLINNKKKNQTAADNTGCLQADVLSEGKERMVSIRITEKRITATGICMDAHVAHTHTQTHTQVAYSLHLKITKCIHTHDYAYKSIIWSSRDTCTYNIHRHMQIALTHTHTHSRGAVISFTAASSSAHLN